MNDFDKAVSYAVSARRGRAAGIAPYGFRWRAVPGGLSGQRFWEAWRHHREAMEAAGFAMTRSEGGLWLVSYRPKGPQADVAPPDGSVVVLSKVRERRKRGGGYGDAA